MMNKKGKQDRTHKWNMWRKVSITVIRDWLGFVFTVVGFWLSLPGTVHTDVQMSQHEASRVSRYYIFIFEIEEESLNKQALILIKYSENEGLMQQKKIGVPELLIVKDSNNCIYITFRWQISYKYIIRIEIRVESERGFYLFPFQLRSYYCVRLNTNVVL